MPVFDIYDDKSPRRIQAETDCITIGRTGDIVVNDRVASRQHCEIRASGAGYILSDLTSRNGTTLNLELVERPIALSDGDEIGIGRATVRFWTDLTRAEATLPAEPFMPRSASGHKPTKPTRHGSRPSQPPQAPVPSHTPAPDERHATPNSPGDAHDNLDSNSTDAEPPIQVLPLDIPDVTSHTAPPPPSSILPIPADAGSLTVDGIVLLNHEGKPSHAVDPRTGQVSEPMLRLKELLLRGFQFGATDIHIEPKAEFHQLRYRIDGTLHALGTLESNLVRAIHSIIKILCNIDLNQRNAMQDGSFDVNLPDRRVQLRISIAPSITGDKMVIRVLDTNLAPGGLSNLEMEPYVLEQVRRKTAQNSSMIVVCGPTGSGKTTTVYAVLREMNAHDRNIVTVEQPVEYKLDSVSQIEVAAETSRGNTITFTDALRSLLRQDPDVILVGEIRDADTARMAVQAAMTGHLLLSTVHARDSIGCIFRLLDLGVEPFLLASALTAVLSQRLLRRLCPQCKSLVKPAISQLSGIGLDDLAGRELYTAVGCNECLGIGYKRRVPIFELLSINDQVRDAIANRPTIQQLRVAAGDWIFQTLREDGIRKLRAGLTSLDEFTRVAHQDV